MINNKDTSVKYLYDTIVLSGGGLKGLYTLGSILYLEEKELINIKKYIGTSVGSIICLLLSIGYKAKFLMEYLSKIKLKNILSKIDVLNLFKENFGCTNSTKFIDIIKLLMSKKKINEDITFIELYKKTNKEIIIIGSSLSPITACYFNYENSPEIKVIDAIRISINIPFIFPYIEMNCEIRNNKILTNTNNKMKFVDGSLTNNYGIEMVNKKDNAIGIIVLNEDKSIEKCNFYDYFMYICEFYINKDSKNKSMSSYLSKKENIKNIVIIDNKLNNNNLLNILLNHEENMNMKEFYEIGYNIIKSNLEHEIDKVNNLKKTIT